MSTRVKTREQLLSAPYLSTVEIGRLLDIPYRQAKKIFTVSMKIDQEQLKELMIFDNKVRFKTVMKVSGNDFNLLAKQIKNAPAVAEHSAINQ